MNKDLDERLLPSGEMSHAENIRVSSSDSSDAGALENVKGNFPLTNFSLTNAVTIGGYADSSNQKLYWMVTSDTKDMVIEYDVRNSVVDIVLQSTAKTGVLNFDKNFLITGVVKTSNDDPTKDLLGWVDDRNNPRLINIDRCKKFSLDGFIEEDICLIKKPPTRAPKTQLTYTNTSLENNLEDKFLSFATQYKYLDGEYSALSSFSNYAFEPEKFELDYQTLDNVGMKNMFNAVNITFNTGSERVTDIRVVFKESNSNTVFIAETFNKKKEMWEDNTEKSTKFSNSKKYIALPEDELFRAYDNVPLKAKTLSMVGNRLVMGNYEEGYDLINKNGEVINIDYDISFNSKEVDGKTFPSTVAGVGNNKITVNLTGAQLKEGSKISFQLNLKEVTYNKGNSKGSYDFILSRDFVSVADLALDYEFGVFVESIISGKFREDYEATPPANTVSTIVSNFSLEASGDTISIVAPKINYTIDDTPSDTGDNPANTHTEVSLWSFEATSNVFLSNSSSSTSLKSNRSYEAGIIYLDPFNRATTVLTDNNNSIFIPQGNSVNQNKIILNINSLPPVWADRYKVVVKTNKDNYQTIYSNFIYKDGLYAWFRLDGSNKDKVKEGEYVILKADSDRAFPDVLKLKVLEIKDQPKNFITDNLDKNGNEIIEEAGLYMKIKVGGFSVPVDSNKFYKNSASASNYFGYPTCYVDLFTYTDEANVQKELAINAGSTVTFFFDSKFNYKAGWSSHKYKRSFLVLKDYTSIEAWYNDNILDIAMIDEDGHNYGNNIRLVRRDNNKLFLSVTGIESSGSGKRGGFVNAEVSVSTTKGFFIFETEGTQTSDDIFYETQQTFSIVDGLHTGNIQNQTATKQAIIELDAFNCYVQGNGAESYRYNDAFNTNYLNLDLRPSLTSIEKYKKVRRFADLTYSEPYNENNNLNGLNEFNLSRANYKEDISKEYGYIQKTHSRDTDLLVLQEDKVSKVMFGKSVLMNADGSQNVTSIEDVLGQQVAYSGEYGISKDASSFVFSGHYIYWVDSKRGAVMRLAGDGLNEVSSLGMKHFFKDKLKNTVNNKKVGGFDPYYDEYALFIAGEEIIPPVGIDCSGAYLKEDFKGEFSLSLDMGSQTGSCGFTYETGDVPVKMQVEWDGKVIDFGIAGSTDYNSQLIESGYTEVTLPKSGSYTFNKKKKSPKNIIIRFKAPIAGASLKVQGTCPLREIGNVYYIVVNQKSFKGSTSLTRYKSITDEYVSDLKSKSLILSEDKVASFERVTGYKGTGYIPDDQSTLSMETFQSANEVDLFAAGKMGFLSTNTVYDEASINTLLSSMSVVPKTRSVSTFGDVTYRSDFEVPENYKNLYLVYYYLSPPTAVNDTYNLRQGGTLSNINILENDSNPNAEALTVVIKTQPQYGTITVNVDQTVTYMHDDSTATQDFFEYSAQSTNGESNTARVTLNLLPKVGGGGGGGTGDLFIDNISDTLDGFLDYNLNVATEFVGYVRVTLTPLKNVREASVTPYNYGDTVSIYSTDPVNAPKSTIKAVTIPVGVIASSIQIEYSGKNPKIGVSCDASIAYSLTSDFSNILCEVTSSLRSRPEGFEVQSE